MAKTEADASQDVQAIRDEFQTLRSDMEKVRSDMGELLGTLVDAGKHKASDAKDAVKDELEERIERLRTAFEGAKDQGEHAVHSVQHKIEEHPLTSVVLAFGVGMVAGTLLGRR